MPSALPFADFYRGPVSRPQPLLHFSLFLFSLQFCTTLDHFGYPAPLFLVWTQACWYNLHLTEVWLRARSVKTLSMAASPVPTIGVMLVRFATPGGEHLRVLTRNHSNQCSHLLFQPGACRSAHSGPERTTKLHIARASSGLDRRYWHRPQTHSA